MHRRNCSFGCTTIGGRRFRSAGRVGPTARLSFSRISCLAPAFALLLALSSMVPLGALGAQERESLPSPMSGIEVSESQRTAMRASWALVAGEWDAILERSRAAGTVSTEDSRRLARLASEHNERLLGIFTPEQRGRLERNLEALRVERERRVTEVKPEPPVNDGATQDADEAGEEVDS